MTALKFNAAECLKDHLAKIEAPSEHRTYPSREIVGRELLIVIRSGDPVGFQRMLHAQRANAEKLFNLVGEGNRLVGFRSFKTSGGGEGGATE